MATATMEKKAIETELMKLEKRYWQAIKGKDIDTMLSLTEFPCIVAGATGVGSLDRDTFMKIMKDEHYTLHDFEVKNSEVRALSDDVACVAYEVHEDLTVDGKSVSMEATDSSVWVRRNGRWLCAMHTESLKGDPYGRDRTGTKTA